MMSLLLYAVDTLNIWCAWMIMLVLWEWYRERSKK